MNPQINQRCFVTGIGFGIILRIEEVQPEGFSSAIITKLQIRFDAGGTRWKSLKEVELVEAA